MSVWQCLWFIWQAMCVCWLTVCRSSANVNPPINLAVRLSVWPRLTDKTLSVNARLNFLIFVSICPSYARGRDTVSGWAVKMLTSIKWVVRQMDRSTIYMKYRSYTIGEHICDQMAAHLCHGRQHIEIEHLLQNTGRRIFSLYTDWSNVQFIISSNQTTSPQTLWIAYYNVQQMNL